jgi:protein tyrosine/serine phosphatase
MHTRAGLVRASAAAFLLATVLAPAAVDASGNSRARNTGVEASAINIDNFGRVAPTFYRGAQPDGRDYADLKALGIKTIINLTSDDADPAEQTMAEQAGIAYVQIPMSTHTAPTAEQLASFLRIVNDPASQPVYVHCVGGRHRTGVMTAAYRMTQEGWTSDQAFREMKQYNFGADFLHPEFKAFVYSYRPATAAASATASSSAAAVK